MTNVKKRYWAFVLYLDSAPNNWRDILQDTGLPICISPYHDSDVNPDGTDKKPHYHIILCYDGPTTFKNVKALTDKLCQPIPIPLEQVRGYYRYLTHKDNPDKFQYNESDIECINGFYLDNYIDLTQAEIDSICISILGIIEDNQIYEYRDLLYELKKLDLIQYLKVATKHTILFNTYITSLRNKNKYK